MVRASERLEWRSFEELSLSELYEVLRLRCRVFVVEQNCSYEDVDGLDPEATHLLARSPEVPGLSGYLRCLVSPGNSVRIGRVVTAPEARSNGLGKRLMEEALCSLASKFEGLPVELSAQTHLERFYGGFGFVRVSADYTEDGIVHCDMRLSLQPATGP